MDVIDSILQKGIEHHMAGRLSQARSLYKQVLSKSRNHPDAFHLLGVIAHQSGNSKRAIDLIEKAIAINPHTPDYYNNCGEAYRALGQLKLAIDRYEQALSLNPKFPDAHNNLGNARRELGQLDSAIASYRSALLLNSRYAEAHNNLGNAIKEQGQLDEAVRCYRRALALNPSYANAHNNLGIALNECGQKSAAIQSVRRAIQLQPDRDYYFETITHLLKDVSSVSVDSRLKGDLISCYTQNNINYQNLERTAVSVLLEGVEFRDSITEFIQADPKASISMLDTKALQKLLLEPLFLLVLKKSLVTSYVLELFLIKCRLTLLSYLATTDQSASTSTKLEEFIVALASQCFLNDFMYPELPQETIWLSDLQRMIIEKNGTASHAWRPAVALVGCYLPLYSLQNYKDYAATDKRGLRSGFAGLIELQVLQPLKERALRKKVKSIGSIEDEISKKVRSQYEENPYPRWISTNLHKSLTIKAFFQATFPHLAIDLSRVATNPEILIAGCGTGRHAINSATWLKSSRVLAIDLSTASLAYAIRKTEEMGISNIRYCQGDILGLGELNKQFDIIECCGVLHHMSDPVAGLSTLVGLLKPGGFMKIGLYSEQARRYVLAARSFIQENGYQSTLDDMRKCRQDIIALPEDDPARKVIESKDFYSMSTTRDLIFHVQEHRFTIPEISAILIDQNLDFLAFDVDGSTLQKYRVRFPTDNSYSSLKNWDSLERANPSLFAHMYQFWVQKGSRS